jgi:hypothetical protein
VCGREIDLERASKGLLVSEVLEETGIVLRASTDQVHRVSVGRTELDVLATVKECASKVRADMKIDRLDGYLTGTCFLRRCHLNKRSLVGMAGERAKEFPEVVPARRTGGDDQFCSSNVIT